MTLHPEDGAIVRAVADEVRKANDRARRVEIALVTLAAVCTVAAAGFGGWNTWRLREIGEQNERGVVRIVDCTTQGMPCFEEQAERTNELVGTFLVRLNESHLRIECKLNVLPANRGPQVNQRCDEEAKKNTADALAELERVNREARAKAEQKARTNGGNTDGD